MFCRLHDFSYLSIRAGLYLKPPPCEPHWYTTSEPTTVKSLNLVPILLPKNVGPWLLIVHFEVSYDASHLSYFHRTQVFSWPPPFFKNGLVRKALGDSSNLVILPNSCFFYWISRSGFVFDKGPLTGLWLDYPFFFSSPDDFSSPKMELFACEDSFRSPDFHQGPDCTLSPLRWTRPSLWTNTRAVPKLPATQFPDPSCEASLKERRILVIALHSHCTCIALSQTDVDALPTDCPILNVITMSEVITLPIAKSFPKTRSSSGYQGFPDCWGVLPPFLLQEKETNGWTFVS